MDWVKIVEYTALAVGLVAGVFLGYKEWKERKARDRGLSPNPVRCEDHEGRLRKVENVCIEMGPRMEDLEDDITEIKGDVKHLINLHMEK